MRQTTLKAELEVTIHSVLLTVRFPCKMVLHHGNTPITGELEPNGNQFLFNEDATIKTNTNENIEITAYLVKGKGTSAIQAGLITFSVAWLAAREGERLTLPLQKCHDSSAVLEMTVNQVWIQEERPCLGIARSQEITLGTRAYASPAPKFEIENECTETRSDVQAASGKRIQVVAVGKGHLQNM
jgi:hypothetical protein